jgi:guanosine-3',5'-bis(diphosphate) 3'-pyrophosphohydrolase
LFMNELTAVGLETLPPESIIERLLTESNAKTMEELYIDIGIGKRMAPLVARHVIRLIDSSAVDVPRTHIAHTAVSKPDPILITGNEGASVQLATCCQPIPGDKVRGYLRHGQNLVVHLDDCETAKRLHEKEPDRWIDLDWKYDPSSRFDCRITILTHNQRGTLAKIAAQIGEADANILSVSMDDDGDQLIKYLRFTIQVSDRVHLARVMRNIRTVNSVARILRERNSGRNDL